MTKRKSESTRERLRREATHAEVVLDPKTGAWTLESRGTVVEAGKWERRGARRVVAVSLTYDPGVYFDCLVDRRRAEDRGDMLRSALETALRALDLCANQAPHANARIAADMVRATLADPFEVSVGEEIRERREAEGRRQDERRRAKAKGGK